MTPKNYFEKEGINPVEFALKLKIGVTTIYRYLRGASSPSRERAKMLEKATNGKVTAPEWRNADGDK